MLPDDPLPLLHAGLRLLLPGVLVVGERPPDLTRRLPVVVISRHGGIEIESTQDVLGDRPIIAADTYARGLPAAFVLAQRVRRAMRALGARPVTGPVETPDADEAEQVRRVTCTWTHTTH